MPMSAAPMLLRCRAEVLCIDSYLLSDLINVETVGTKMGGREGWTR